MLYSFGHQWYNFNLYALKYIINNRINNQNITTRPRSSNSLSRSASWSLSPCKRPLVASAMDGGICNRSSVWPSRPLAAAAWAWAWAWSCWQVAYILSVVAIKNTPSTSQSYSQEGPISHLWKKFKISRSYTTVYLNTTYCWKPKTENTVAK